MPAADIDLPSTLERSPEKVRRTYEEALENAEETYRGDEARAHRVAWAAVKHIAEKQGDHWVLKDEPGPSDAQAAKGGAEARHSRDRTAGGVNARKSKDELYEDAKRAGIDGRSKMSKDELVRALERHNDRQTSRARC